MNQIIKILLLSLISISVFGATSVDPETTKEKEIKLEVYPNPITGSEFTIKSETELVEVVILNIVGKQVFRKQYGNETKIEIELETKEKGLYILQVKSSDNQVATTRILFK